MTGEILTFNLREFVDLRVERLLKTKRGLYCFAYRCRYIRYLSFVPCFARVKRKRVRDFRENKSSREDISATLLFHSLFSVYIRDLAAKCGMIFFNIYDRYEIRIN